MVDISPLIPKGKQVVETYGNGGFKVSGVRYEGSILVLPDTVVPLSVSDFSDITLDLLEPILANAETVSVLLVGCGVKQQFFSAEIERKLKSLRIVAEPMDTGAACRTYNVLLSEGRDVAALLMAV